jgi:hypothetical protein
MSCDKNCIDVGNILYVYPYNKNDAKLIKLEAYKSIVNGDFGHINYALAAYCVSNNHIECLKKLHQTVDLEWHNDLAIVALECNNITGLKYIVNEMRNVEITPEITKALK